MSDQNLAFQHKLESLLRDCAVTNSAGYSEALEALRDMAPDLARRVIAAEKLVGALEQICSASGKDAICPLITAYREASK